MCSDPVELGYIPDINAVRAGAHTGAVLHAFRYNIPRLPSASRFGVTA
jgi:hypothetical protein